jgi:hypothetical protein
VIHLFFKLARKVEEGADFVLVQLTEQEPGIYNKRHPGGIKLICLWKKFIIR